MTITVDRHQASPTEEPVGAGVPVGSNGVRGWRRRILRLLPDLGAYLALSVVIWWHVWSTHPTSVTTCGCGDSSLFTWFLAWPAHAIAHGLDPWYSTAMFHPTGVNLLANTSEVGIGVVLAPVTWLFGPVATLNVALTLSPVLAALAMDALLRRWVSWAPAAFVGGLLYGFSPLVLMSLTEAHLMVGLLVIPPLIVGCLDQLLVRQNRRPAAIGVVLGTLVAVQYFIGTEVLAIVVVTLVVSGLVAMVVIAITRPSGMQRRLRHAAIGLGWGGATVAVLLAYPVWFTLAGPAHLSGSVWPASVLGRGGTAPMRYLLPAAPITQFLTTVHRTGGYQGAIRSAQYLGVGLVAVVVVGLVLWRRDRRLWLFAGVALVSVALSFGLENRDWVPWRLLVRVPLVQNIIPLRFMAVTYLCAAVLVGLVVDHVHRAVAIRVDRHAEGRRWSPSRFAAAIAGVGVAVVALVPVATYLAGGLPVTTQAVVVPVWFRTVAPRLPAHQVLLVVPMANSLLQSAMTWQAVDGMHYSMVGGGGPAGSLSRAGVERAGQTVLDRTSIGFQVDSVTPNDVEEVRKAIDAWGVTTVVVPDQSNLPAYEKVDSVVQVTTLLTASLGVAPVHQPGAWVWTNVAHAGPPVVLDGSTLGACATGRPGPGPTAVPRAATCVLERTGAGS